MKTTNRKFYAAHSYMGLNISYTSDCWKVAQFDSKKERDEWVYANEHDGQKRVSESCTYKTARKILGCDPNSDRVIKDGGQYLAKRY